MRKSLLMFATLLACMASGTGASATAEPALTPFVAWRVEFGGSSHAFSPSFSAGLLKERLSGGEATAPEVIRLTLTSEQLVADFAGVPLVQRNFRLNQLEDAAPSELEETSWYQEQWVWWTASGLAAVALGSAVFVEGVKGIGDHYGESFGSSNNSGSSDCSTSGGCGVGCVNGTCVAPCDSTGPLINTCLTGNGKYGSAGWRENWFESLLDDETGNMGDLILR